MTSTIDTPAAQENLGPESPANAERSPRFRYLSRPQRNREDRRFVSGHGRYVADITLPDTLHVGLVTSPHAHANILSVDASAALEVDGVVAVLTGAELAEATEPLRQYIDVPEVQWR